MTASEKMKAARVKAGLTQKQLADLLGCSSQNIYQWESGKYKLTYPSMVRIAAALGVPVDSIWTLSEQNRGIGICEETIDQAEKNASTISEGMTSTLLDLWDSLPLREKGELLTFAATLADSCSWRSIRPEKSKVREVRELLR